jgi:hypothetical protein
LSSHLACPKPHCILRPCSVSCDPFIVWLALIWKLAGSCTCVLVSFILQDGLGVCHPVLLPPNYLNVVEISAVWWLLANDMCREGEKWRGWRSFGLCGLGSDTNQEGASRSASNQAEPPGSRHAAQTSTSVVLSVALCSLLFLENGSLFLHIPSSHSQPRLPYE